MRKMTTFVGVRFSQEEYEKLQQIANAKTEGNVSAALRYLIDQAHQVKKVSVVWEVGEIVSAPGLVSLEVQESGERYLPEVVMPAEEEKAEEEK